MKDIYLDEDYMCHVESAEGLTHIETDFFDGKVDSFIEGYRYIPEGHTWTRDDGVEFIGEMISPAVDYAELDGYQRVDEREALESLGLIGVEPPSNLAETTKDNLSLIDFSVSERNAKALVGLDYILFSEYLHDPSRQYQRGEVVRVGEYKYLLTNNGNITTNPADSTLCKLFRSKASYDLDGTPREWVREEFCMRGFERHYNNKWYRVKVDVVDSATPPSNDTNAWEEISISS